MRIGFVSVADPRDIASWSGIPFHMSAALDDAGAEVVRIGPLRDRLGPPAIARELANRVRRRRAFHRERDLHVAEGYWAQAAHRVAEANVDAVLSPGSIPLARAAPGVPVASWTDATFANLVDYYPEYSALTPRTLRDGHALERQAIERAGALIYASAWAADSAVRDYGADPNRVHVVPFGANLDAPSRDRLERAVAERSSEHLGLTIVAADWARKRGDFAVATVGRLIELGVPATLTVVGAGPRHAAAMPDYVHLGGAMHKSAGGGALTELLLETHILLLPSRAECFGVASCEANACGVPVIGTDTGGVHGAVRDDQNGLLLPPDATPDDHARAVLALVEDPRNYRRLALGAREEFDTRLNWATGAQRVLDLLGDIDRPAK